MKLQYPQFMPHQQRTVARLSARAGVTLIETCFSVAILAVAFIFVLGVLVKAQEANILNRSRVLAFDEARAVIDQIKDLKATGAAFPDALLKALPDGKEALTSVALKDATRVISWGAKSDPMVVTVTISWKDLRGHPLNISLTSAIGAR